jgi:hypothetical protein
VEFMPEPIPRIILARKEKTTNIVLDSTNIRKPSPKMPITLKVKRNAYDEQHAKNQGSFSPYFPQILPCCEGGNNKHEGLNSVLSLHEGEKVSDYKLTPLGTRHRYHQCLSF